MKFETVVRVEVVLSALAGALFVPAAFKGWFRWMYRHVVGRLTTHSALLSVPTRTITIVPEPGHLSTSWHMGRSGDQAAMQIMGRFIVTNITRYNIVIPVAQMRRPYMLGMVMVKDSESQYHGRYTIPPGATTELGFDFWIVPAIKKEGEVFSADVAIIDQFGNKHWLRKLRFAYR